MQITNTTNNYGLVAVVLHWLVALAVLGLFALGLWIGDLDYYDPWYQRGPALHKGLGVLLFAVVAVRLIWRWINEVPDPEPTHAKWEARFAHATHASLYLLLFTTMIAGYLISSSDGRPVDVLGWFSVPALLNGVANQEDIAGEIHEVSAFVLIGMAVLHAGAALKHHFVDCDRTLKRIIGR